MTVLPFIRRHAMVVATIAAGAVVLMLWTFGSGTGAQWLASVFALAAAAHRGSAMVRDMFHGRWGVDILAVTAIVSTVAVGEYVAALIVVLMLYGGSALEDYASGRAKAELSALLDRVPQRPTGRHRTGGWKTLPFLKSGPEMSWY